MSMNNIPSVTCHKLNIPSTMFEKNNTDVQSLEPKLTVKQEGNKNVKDNRTVPNFNLKIPCKREKKCFQCVECGHVASSRYYWKLHMKGVHLKIKDCKCIECNSTFSYPGSLARHNKIVHRKKGLQCTECSYVTSSRIALQLHINGVHLKIKEYRCIECNSTFSHPSALSLHTRNIHLKPKKFTCDKCGYSTYSTSHLRRHTNDVHLKIKDYKCNKCDSVFSRNSTLGDHIRIVHLNIRQYQCNLCEHSSKTRSNLKTHMKAKHPQVRCNLCNESYKNYPSLQTHMKTNHVQEERVRCNLCNESYKDYPSFFAHSFNCAKHICYLCGKISKDYILLGKHMKDVHNVVGSIEKEKTLP